MLLDLIRRAGGYVRFRMDGRTPEAFLNAVAARNIPLWEIRSCGEFRTAHTAAANYRQLRTIARENAIRLRVERRFGLPFRLEHMRRRPGIPVGIALFFALQLFLSGFVWQVQISGCSALPDARIASAVGALGIRPGVRLSNVDTEYARLELLRQVPELSWAAVNRLGCRLTIEVRERGAVPEMVPVDEPCNIKARIGGVIVRAQAEDGFAVVHPGDVVHAGDLLVEGMRQDALGATVLHHARGQVIAVTAHTYQSVQPLIRTVQQDTGVTVERRRLAVFGLELPLSLTQAPDGTNYRRTFSESPVTLFGLRLPLSVYTELWTEQTDIQQQCSEEEARRMGQDAVETQFRSDFPDVEPMSREETVEARSGVVTVTLTVTVQEDIGVQEPIYVESSPNSSSNSVQK